MAIYDQRSFPSGAVADGMARLSTIASKVPGTSQEEMDRWVAGASTVLATAMHKLKKRTIANGFAEAVAETIKYFLQGTALLDALRTASPDLHEKIMSAVNSRSCRLQFVGSQGGTTAGAILSSELDCLISAMRTAAPSLSIKNSEQIAYGSICEWIMRCPLDFPDDR